MNFVHHQNIEAKPAMSGKDLAERLPQMRPDARAVLALEFTNGRTLSRPTRVQAAKLTGVSPYNLSIAALATADEREGLMRGRLKLSDVRRAHAHPRKATIGEIENLIRNADPNDVMSVFDRLTAPPLSVAAE
jgi:hypothetical protein